ncbi:MAG TPA: tetratricopeptide repeat protein [Vicinamibacteria bacterium]
MRPRHLVPAVALLLALPAFSRAQDVTTAVGIVMGPDGKPLADAEVVIDYKGHLAKTYRTKTDKSGRFMHVRVFTGPHDITISKEGLGEITVKDFTFHDLGQFEKPPTFGFGQRKVAAPAPPAGAPGAPPPAGGTLAGELQQLAGKLSAGQVDEALAGYEALAAREPGSSTVHRMLGGALKRKGDSARAEAELRKAVELDPQDPLAHRDLAVFFYETSRLNDALAEAEKAASLHPDDPGLLFNLGLIYQSAGRSQEAWDTLLKAEAKDPLNAELQYHLGTVALGLNKADEAVARFQRYVDAKPGNAQNLAAAQGLIAALSKKK